MEFRIGDKFDNIAPSKNISKSKSKFLLIHGIDDETVPIEQAEELYNLSNKDNTTLWKIEGKAHSNCNHHPEFWPKVLEFLKISL